MSRLLDAMLPGRTRKPRPNGPLVKLSQRVAYGPSQPHDLVVAQDLVRFAAPKVPLDEALVLIYDLTDMMDTFFAEHTRPDGTLEDQIRDTGSAARAVAVWLVDQLTAPYIWR
jgi:hypothetical protein